MITNDREIAESLREYLQKSRETVRKSETYQIIKRYCQDNGNWKAAARGNPRKGYQMMREKSQQASG